MKRDVRAEVDVSAGSGSATGSRKLVPRFALQGLGLALGVVLWTSGISAQVSVVTAHNDIARTGQNLSETTLTPANVNSTQFGQLFSQTVNGQIFAQPLFVPNVTMPGKPTSNVVYVATGATYADSGDMVYAFDADVNGGVGARPMWSVSLLTNTTPAGTFQLAHGVVGTPVIDLTSGTMYLVSNELQGANSIFRLHALDITTGAEKFGGPVLIQGTVPGTGSGSSGGTLAFDGSYERQRPGLLLLNGVVYIAFGSADDTGPWHGWIFSYNAATLQQINVFCTAANGSGGGIWMGGSGLAAEVNNPSQPYGRMFVSTGNGMYAASLPLSNTMSYGMSVLNLDLTGGVMTVQDSFTPSNWSTFSAQDGDLGSGGPVLLPAQTLGSESTLSPLVQVGKTGAIYILDRNNLGSFNASGDQTVQEVQTPESGAQSWGAGIWGTSAYWNQNTYFGGTNPGASNSLTAYSFVKGQAFNRADQSDI